MNDLAQVRVVLVRPQVPGNIGASARAMAAMGLSELWLVAPREFPHPEATRRATEAADLLEQARCVQSLDQAIGDCELVIATSARRRGRWPHLTPTQAAKKLRECGGASALLFGPEPSGLTSQQLEQAQFCSSIPLAAQANSLNLSHAVQLYAWELRRARAAPDPDRSPLATRREMNHLYQLLNEVLTLTEPQAPATGRLRRYQALLNRATPTRDEWQLLEGLLQRVAQRFKNPGG